MHSHTAFFLRTAKSTARTKECSTTVRISALMKALKHSSTMLTRHSIIWRDEPSVVGRSEGVRPIWKSGWTLVLLYSLLSPRFLVSLSLREDTPDNCILGPNSRKRPVLRRHQVLR